MPGHPHEIIPRAIDDQPEFAGRLLRLAGVDMPESDRIEVKPADLSIAAPLELRADRVVLGRRPSGDADLTAVVEMQLQPDEEKEFSWPAYGTETRLRHRCEAVVLVICLDDATEAWANGMVRRLPNWMHAVRVLGPSKIPRIVDPVAVMADPWMAVLSALAHRKTAEDAVVLRAVNEGLPVSGLKPEVVDYAWQVIESDLGKAAARALEAMMQLPAGYQAPSARMNREWYDKGLERGEARGEAKGYRMALTRLIKRRAILLTPAEQARIDACEDLNQLDAWHARAETATLASQIFEPNG